MQFRIFLKTDAIADKSAEIADNPGRIADKRREIADNPGRIADKSAEIADNPSKNPDKSNLLRKPVLKSVDNCLCAILNFELR
ncbi:hypothetical protein ABH968_003670 [Lysinibacillus sp. RC79]